MSRAVHVTSRQSLEAMWQVMQVPSPGPRMRTVNT